VAGDVVRGRRGWNRRHDAIPDGRGLSLPATRELLKAKFVTSPASASRAAARTKRGLPGPVISSCRELVPEPDVAQQNGGRDKPKLSVA